MKSLLHVLRLAGWWACRVLAWVSLVLLAAKVCSHLFCWADLSNYGGCTAPAQVKPTPAPVVISCSEACRYV